MEETTINTDVLVVGGGIAGCTAALRATEFGVKVAITEKSHVSRSGNASTGIDHYLVYIPEIHGAQGYSQEDFLQDYVNSAGGFADRGLMETITRVGYVCLKEWEKYGIPMKDENGNYRLVGKDVGRLPTFVHFAGQVLKVKLAKELSKRGIQIFNRIMITDLLKDDGRIVGALGMSTRKEEIIVFLAKTVILATGDTNRLYRNRTGLFFNTDHAPTCTGDGRTMAFRAGAELLNMEFFKDHAGPKSFHRCGRGSYHPGGVMTEADGTPLGKSKKQFVDLKAYQIPSLELALNAGRGPIYMDCSACSTEDLKYIRWALSNEGNTSFLDYLDSEGLDLRKDRIEFEIYEPRISGFGGAGIAINTECRASLPGLFAAGDEVGGIQKTGCSAAAAMGYVAAEAAAKECISQNEVKLVVSKVLREEISMKKEMYHQILCRSEGTGWQSVLLALQNVMSDYCLYGRSETMLEAGLNKLRRIRRYALERLKARNPHELMRCLEVLNLLDVGEMVMLAARERKESRLSHVRIDFPEQNDKDWLKFLAMKRKEDGMVRFSARRLTETKVAM